MFFGARENPIFYQPFHLFSRVAKATNHPLQFIGLLTLVPVAASLFLRMKARAEEWIAYSGLLLDAAFIPVGVGGYARPEDCKAGWFMRVCAGWDRIFCEVKAWLVGCRQGG